MLLHLGDKPAGFRAVWKGDPYHALQVANANPGRNVVFTFVWLDKVNIFAPK